MDERSRHQLYRKLEVVMGREEATTLMEPLPPTGWSEVATKQDMHQQIEALRRELHGDLESLARRVIMWMSGMVLATAALAFAAGRFV